MTQYEYNNDKNESTYSDLVNQARINFDSTSISDGVPFNFNYIEPLSPDTLVKPDSLSEDAFALIQTLNSKTIYLSSCLWDVLRELSETKKEVSTLKAKNLVLEESFAELESKFQVLELEGRTRRPPKLSSLSVRNMNRKITLERRERAPETPPPNIDISEMDKQLLQVFHEFVKKKIVVGSWEGSPSFTLDYGLPLTTRLSVLQQLRSPGLMGGRFSGLNTVTDDIVPLSVALSCTSRVQALVLFNNNIGDEGTNVISSSLSQNSSLLLLHLGNNNIGDDGAKSISLSLIKNSTLQLLDLGSNNIGIEGAKALSFLINKNPTIQLLHLGDNKIGDEGVIAICSSLGKNSTLQVLDLGGNNIGIEGAKAIAWALSQNSSLQVLSLYNNNIGTEGSKTISSSLSQNYTLEVLYLGANNIGLEGAKAIYSSISQNSTLQIVNLKGNNIPAETQSR
ncbi:hypothetical protein HK096_002669, partial [Nowakowskiella sp. JEL0078]